MKPIMTLSLLCLFATSCATSSALRHRHSFEKRTYAGTAIDLEIISGFGDYYDFGQPAGSLFCSFSIVDLPLSFVADTILLPYTVYADVKDSKEDKKTELEN